MTKGDNINLFNALNKLGNLVGVRFAYAVSRNISLLKPEYEAIQEAIKPSEAFTAYEKERIALVESFAKKDEKGKAVSENGAYVLEDQEGFDKAFELLKETHKEAVDGRTAQQDEVNELLKNESTVELHKVSLDNVPEGITVAQLHSISDIISEEIPTPYK